jgi:hypothetical protein
MRGFLNMLAAAIVLSAATSAGAATATRVELKPTAKGVEATFTLSSPVTRFTLQEAVEDVRGDTWHVQTPGVVLAKGAVSRADGAGFTTFSVLVTPDSRPRDRRYPALTGIGGGWQVYGPYFQAAEGQPPVEASLAPPKGWTTVPAAKAGRVALDGYVYVGPAAMSTPDPRPSWPAPKARRSCATRSPRRPARPRPTTPSAWASG